MAYIDSNGYSGSTCEKCGTFIIKPTTDTITFVDGSKGKYQELKEYVKEALKNMDDVVNRIEDILADLEDNIYSLDDR